MSISPFFGSTLIFKNEISAISNYKFSGIASIPQKDGEGEFLDPKGFDLSEFKWVNWVHEKEPKSLIGEITYSIVQPDGKLYIEGILHYKNPKAQEVYNLGLNVQESGAGNNLALSVEGRAIERNPKNKAHVTKSKLTAVAICPTPVNKGTFVEFMKSFKETLTYNEINGIIQKTFKKLSLNKAKTVTNYIINYLEENNMNTEKDSLVSILEKLGVEKSEIQDALYKAEGGMDEDAYKKMHKTMKGYMSKGMSKKEIMDKMMDLGKSMGISPKEQKNAMEQMHSKISKEMEDEMADDSDDDMDDEETEKMQKMKKAFNSDFDDNDDPENIVKAYIDYKNKETQDIFKSEMKSLKRDFGLALLKMHSLLDNFTYDFDKAMSASESPKSIAKAVHSPIESSHEDDILKSVSLSKNRDEFLDVVEEVLGIEKALSVEAGNLAIINNTDLLKVAKEKKVRLIG